MNAETAYTKAHNEVAQYAEYRAKLDEMKKGQ